MDRNVEQPAVAELLLHFQDVAVSEGLSGVPSMYGDFLPSGETMQSPRFFSVSRMPPSGNVIKYGNGSTQATTSLQPERMQLGLQGSLRHDDCGVVLEGLVVEAGARFGDEQRQRVDRLGVERLGPGRHAHVRIAVGDARFDLGERTAAAQIHAHQRHALPRSLHALTVTIHAHFAVSLP